MPFATSLPRLLRRFPPAALSSGPPPASSHPGLPGPRAAGIAFSRVRATVGIVDRERRIFVIGRCGGGGGRRGQDAFARGRIDVEVHRARGRVNDESTSVSDGSADLVHPTDHRVETFDSSPTRVTVPNIAEQQGRLCRFPRFIFLPHLPKGVARCVVFECLCA